MLTVVILAVCFGLAFLGLMMCRLAARSDAYDAVALAEWLGGGELAPGREWPANAAGDGRQARTKGPDEPYRATG